MNKKIVTVVMVSMQMFAFDPIPTHTPLIDIEIETQHKRIHDAMTKVNEIEKKIQKVEQKKVQIDPANDSKALDLELQQLQAEIKQAKEVARIEKNKLNELQHQQEDRESMLSN